MKKCEKHPLVEYDPAEDPACQACVLASVIRLQINELDLHKEKINILESEKMAANIGKIEKWIVILPAHIDLAKYPDQQHSVEDNLLLKGAIKAAKRI